MEWTSLLEMAVPRNYHSVALLLADGRVLASGGGLCGSCSTNHFDAEILWPPYLFDDDGALATRPVISASPHSVVHGMAVAVDSDSELKTIAIVRFGSATHSVNTDQRRLELCGPASSPCSNRLVGGRYLSSVTIPTDPGIAIPGYWMLFGINQADVPSISETLHLPTPVQTLSPAGNAAIVDQTSLVRTIVKSTIAAASAAVDSVQAVVAGAAVEAKEQATAKARKDLAPARDGCRKPGCQCRQQQVQQCCSYPGRCILPRPD